MGNTGDPNRLGAEELTVHPPVRFLSTDESNPVSIGLQEIHPVRGPAAVVLGRFSVWASRSRSGPFPEVAGLAQANAGGHPGASRCGP